jgi:hypothetical protein
MVILSADKKNKKMLRGRFVEQKLMPSSSFRCDLIYKYDTYDFGHTLLCYLSPI